MAKRFGRNQKRRMREEIASLQGSVQSSTSRANSLQTEYLQTESRLINWARSMNRYLGDYHPLNEEIRSVFLNRVPYMEERYKFMKRQVNFNTFLDREMASTPIEIVSIYIDTVLHFVDVKRDEVNDNVIAQLISPDKKCFYAIDGQMISQGRRDPRFVQWLSEELATKLSEHLCNNT